MLVFDRLEMLRNRRAFYLESSNGCMFWIQVTLCPACFDELHIFRRTISPVPITMTVKEGKSSPWYDYNTRDSVVKEIIQTKVRS